MGTYERPGVYIEEIPLFPPSVAGVSTAVPAFLGYTEFDKYGGDGSNSIVNKPIRITNLLEFTKIFGGPPPLNDLVDITGEKPTVSVFDTTSRKFILYYAVKMFFQYGDSPCYIISTGSFKDATTGSMKSGPTSSDFDNALLGLEKEDEPTLIVIPEAIFFGSYAEYQDIFNKALKQCETLKDRFVIMDVREEKADGDEHIDVTKSMNTFRNDGIGTSSLKYGSAYFPCLNTVMRYFYSDEMVKVDNGVREYCFNSPNSNKGLRVNYRVDKTPDITKTPKVEIKSDNVRLLQIINGQLLFEGIGDGDNLDEIIDKLQNTDFQAYKLNGATDSISSENDIVKSWGCFINAEEKSPVPIMVIISSKEGSQIVFNSTEQGIIDFEVKTDKQQGTEKLTITLPSTGTKAKEIVARWREKIQNPTPKFDPLSFYIGYLGSDAETDIKAPQSSSDLPIDKTVFKTSDDGLLFYYKGGSQNPSIKFKRFYFEIDDKTDSINPKLSIIGVGTNGIQAWKIVQAWGKRNSSFLLDSINGGSDLIATGPEQTLVLPTTLSSYKILDSGNYAKIVNLLDQQVINNFPPSSSIAGIYAKVDRERGVWKAPANVSLTGVVGPSIKITDEEHDRLNIHAEGGKSINAIRNYTGKGTLVMGARTLAGNDNEWRYINVRRLFNMVEESVKKATEVFLFEANNITTWLKVKGMIESYLFSLWQSGALVGPTPEKAYFVNVGLGKTMTAQDILEGFMIVDIGMAAVRPAEFIVLRFMHKMQEA